VMDWRPVGGRSSKYRCGEGTRNGPNAELLGDRSGASALFALWPSMSCTMRSLKGEIAYRLAHHATAKLVMARMKANTVQFSTGMPSSTDCPTNQFTQGPPLKGQLKSPLDHFW
jgi:hypothetical protein